MAIKEHPPMRDRRDIGRVVFLSEQIAAAREVNSCCLGVEATLEAGRGSSGLIRQLFDIKTTRIAKTE